MTATIKLTIDTVKEAAKGAAVEDFTRFLRRDASSLSTLAKVQLGREKELYLSEKGRGR